MSATEELFTLQEMAARLKVTPRTIYNYVNAGNIETLRIGGRHRVTEEAIQAFIKRSTDRSTDKRRKATAGA